MCIYIVSCNRTPKEKSKKKVHVEESEEEEEEGGEEEDGSEEEEESGEEEDGSGEEESGDEKQETAKEELEITQPVCIYNTVIIIYLVSVNTALAIIAWGFLTFKHMPLQNNESMFQLCENNRRSYFKSIRQGFKT